MAKLFPVCVCIYIFFHAEGGGRRYPRFEYIFFYTMGAACTYGGMDLGYACRVEEKKKYLLDGPRIEFLRRLVLPSVEEAGFNQP